YVVVDDREDVGCPAVLSNDGREGDAIDVVDLAGGERLSRRDDFVAGCEDGDAGTVVNVDVDPTRRGNGAGTRGGDEVTGPDHDVAAFDGGAAASAVLSLARYLVPAHPALRHSSRAPDPPHRARSCRA